MEASVEDRRPETGTAEGLELRKWQLTGLASSVVIAVSGARVGNLPLGGNGHWWFGTPFPQGTAGSVLAWGLFYMGLIGLVGSWWRLKGLATSGCLDSRRVLVTLLAWSAPLILGPPLFSGDVYSYIAQGALAQEGLNPYRMGPVALAPGPLLSSVAPVWMYTTAPYGPLWVSIARVIATVFGGSLIGATIAARAVELAGPLLLIRYLPRLARQLGASPSVALWLAVLSPLSLISFLASGHNDSLMVGLTVAAVTISLEGRPLAGVLIAALATTVKVPGIAGVAFVALAWASQGTDRWEKAKILAGAGAAAFGVLAGVTEASGLGWGWLGPATLGTPTLVTIPSAPMVALGMTVGNAAAALGLPLSPATSVTIFQGIGALGAVAIGVLVLFKAKGRTMPVALAAAFGAVVLLGPVLWPWYLMWALAILAATRAQRSPVLAAAAVSGAVLMLPNGSSTAVGPAYLVITALSAYGVAWALRSEHWRELLPGLVGARRADRTTTVKLSGDGVML